MARNNYLKFDIAVRDYYGSNNTAIAFGRLLYWSRKQPKGFYKFKQPCKKHPLYKKGDSWGEELGMSRKVLDPIMDRLVNRHLTKREYVRASDKFNGKMFASYTNHKTNQTYYFMDKNAVDEFLSSLAPEKLETPPLPSPVASDAPEDVDNISQETENIPPFLPSDVPGAIPFAPARQQPINTQTTTSLSGDAPAEVRDLIGEQEKLSSKMVELWNSHTQDKVIWYPSTASRLYKVLSDFFGGCIEAFRKYCAAISNVKFLMGKAPNSNFKAWFYWAIKPDTIKSIFQGAYGVKITKDADIAKTSSSTSHDIEDKIDVSGEPELVKQVRKAILSKIGLSPYKSWFDNPQTTMQVVGGKLLLTAQTKFIEDWIKDKYERMLRDALEKHGLSLSIVAVPRVEPVPTQHQATREGGIYKVLENDGNPEKSEFLQSISNLFQKPHRKLNMKSPPKYINPNDEDIEAKKAEFLQAFGISNNYPPMRRA